MSDEQPVEDHVSPFGLHLDKRTGLLALAVLVAISALLFTIASRQHADAQIARVLRCHSAWSKASSDRSALFSEINERKNAADGERADAHRILVDSYGTSPASQTNRDAVDAFRKADDKSKALNRELQRAYAKHPAPLYEKYCAKALKAAGVKPSPAPKSSPTSTVTPDTPITSSPVARGGIVLRDSSDDNSETRIIEREHDRVVVKPTSAPTQGGGGSDDGGSKSGDPQGGRA